jgi:hypothetical protein
MTNRVHRRAEYAWQAAERDRRAEDALIAALKVKHSMPDATINDVAQTEYARRRHPHKDAPDAADAD